MSFNRWFSSGFNAVNHRSVFNLTSKRFFTANSKVMNETSSSNGNLFGGLTKDLDLAKPRSGRLSDRMVAASEGENTELDGEMTYQQKSIGVKNDLMLQKYIQKIQQAEKPATELFLTPLKRKLYEANCKMNGGFFKKNQIVILPSNNQKYRLKLSQQEIEALEPSIYLKSYRLKSSMKKTTQVLRLLNQLDLKTAITQCHFNRRHVAREVGELLQRGVEDAEKLKLDPNDLYISQIWTGSDGNWMRRMEFKGRGRVGILTHPYVHVRCILKSKSVTKKRLEFEAKSKELDKKPWVQLSDKPIRGVANNVYKW